MSVPGINPQPQIPSRSTSRPLWVFRDKHGLDIHYFVIFIDDKIYEIIELKQTAQNTFIFDRSNPSSGVSKYLFFALSNDSWYLLVMIYTIALSI